MNNLGSFSPYGRKAILFYVEKSFVLCYNMDKKGGGIVGIAFSIFYILLQCTWGILQTFLGFIVFLINIKNKHYFYNGSIVTVREAPSSVSLGMFVFVTSNPMKDKRIENKIPEEEIEKRLLVHEYGHTIQSLIFGPLYLIVMGIPSTLWGFLPSCQKKRENGESYFSFFTERFANYLGEKITKEKSMENAII